MVKSRRFDNYLYALILGGYCVAPSASLQIKGLATKYTTLKWPIVKEKKQKNTSGKTMVRVFETTFLLIFSSVT